MFGLKKMNGNGGGVRPASLTVYVIHVPVSAISIDLSSAAMALMVDELCDHRSSSLTVLRIIQPDASQNRHFFFRQRAEYLLHRDDFVADHGLTCRVERVLALDDLRFELVRLADIPQVEVLAGQYRLASQHTSVSADEPNQPGPGNLHREYFASSMGWKRVEKRRTQ